MQKNFSKIQNLQETQEFLSQVFTKSEGPRSLSSQDFSKLAKIVQADSAEELYMRSGVYSDAYFLRLQEILESDFEATQRYLGDARFLDLIVDYLKACPPRSPNAALVGDRLVGFASKSLDWYHDKMLLSLLKLEWSSIESIYSNFQKPSLLKLSDFGPESLLNLKFSIDSSLFWIFEPSAIEDFWLKTEDFESFQSNSNFEKPWIAMRRINSEQIGCQRFSVFEKSAFDMLAQGASLGSLVEEFSEHKEIEGFLLSLGDWVLAGILHERNLNIS